MIKLIIFDWDDVFTRGSKAGYLKCYHEAIASLRVHLSPEEEERRILANWSRPIETEMGGLLKEWPELVGPAVVKYDEVLFGNTFVDNLSMTEGTPELLERLSKKYKLALATGINPKLLKEKIMPKFGIPDVFKQIESVYNLPSPELGKPHPYMVEKILGEQRNSPEEAILVGDARGDVLMARAAEVRPVVVLSGLLSEQEARELNVEFIIPDVTHIEELLPRLSNIEGQRKSSKEIM